MFYHTFPDERRRRFRGLVFLLWERALVLAATVVVAAACRGRSYVTYTGSSEVMKRACWPACRLSLRQLLPILVRLMKVVQTEGGRVACSGNERTRFKLSERDTPALSHRRELHGSEDTAAGWQKGLGGRWEGGGGSLAPASNE